MFVLLEHAMQECLFSACRQVNVVFVKYPDECCPHGCTKHCSCCEVLSSTFMGQTFWKCRCYTYQLVEHRYFETFIIAMILASSLALVSSVSFMVVFPVMAASCRIRTKKAKLYFNSYLKKLQINLFPTP